MLITAHGGALGTGRNSYKYLNTIKNYDIDVIEVDVRKNKELLYISHLSSLKSRKAITLEYVFDYVIENNFKVNCDLKNRGIIGDVIQLAIRKGAADNLIFTGAVRQSDIDSITAGEVYVNKGFYAPIRPITGNLERIKKIIEDCNNEHIKGINIHHRFASDEFIARAKELNVPLSIYTIDEKDNLRRIMSYNVANVTTNIVDKALDIIKESN